MERRTAYAFFIRGFNLGEYHLRRKGSEDDHAELCFTGVRGESDRSRQWQGLLYQRHPSPYRILPSPTSTRSNTHIHRPTLCRTLFAYFLLISSEMAWWGGAPKLAGKTGIVSLDRWLGLRLEEEGHTLMMESTNMICCGSPR